MNFIMNWKYIAYIDGLTQDFDNTIAIAALELSQSSTKVDGGGGSAGGGGGRGRGGAVGWLAQYQEAPVVLEEMI